MKRSVTMAVNITIMLMISTAILYFIAAFQESAELVSGLSAVLQTTFFLAVGIAYVPLAVWIVKRKHTSKMQYIITIAGSLSLIILYILSRTISLPIVGLQEDVGLLDISSKVLQAAIIVSSLYALLSIKSVMRMN